MSRLGRIGSGSGSSAEYDDEAQKIEARNKRAQVHGFSDFKPPREW